MGVNRDAADVTAADIADQMEAVTRLQQQLERQVARHLAVDAAGLAAMEHLIREGESTPTELSRALGISTAAMTLVLDRLAQAGHVVRRPHPTDRRKVVVTPAAGSATAAVALVEPLITAVEALVSGLDARERETVSTFLAGMLRAYGDALDG